MPTSIEYLPEIATAAGFVAGSAMEVFAQHKMAAERKPLTEAWGTDVVPVPESSMLRKLGVSVLGLYVAGFSFINADAWASKPASSLRPRVEVVVDHSAATALFASPPISSINKIATTLASNNLETEAIIARSGGVRTVNVKDVASDKPFGDAPLDQAMQIALDNAERVQGNEFQFANRRSIGIVAITNGNSLGAPEEIVAKAKDANIPIFVVNVEGTSSTSPQIASDLNAIATESKAKYWNVDSTTADKVAADVKKTLGGNETRNTDTTNKWFERGVGALGILAFPRLYKLRKNMPITHKGLNIKGRKS